MSSYQRVGHHTCEARKSKENTLKEVPYKSKYTNVNRNYLGTSYYFGEDNLYTAKWWGKLHYKNNYYIVEFILNIFDEELLDLVGNTKQIREFYELYSSYRERVRNELATLSSNSGIPSIIIPPLNFTKLNPDNI